MRPAEPWRIVGAAGLLMLALTGLVAWEGRARATGREVALPMAAVDPRILLIGRGVPLELYQTLPEGLPCPPGTEAGAPAAPFEERRRAWVALTRAEDGWRVSGQAPRRAEAVRLGQVVVRGTASCFGRGRIELDVGVPRFHADRSEAAAIGRALIGGQAGGQRAYALVSVGPDGRARLNGVEVNGRRVRLEWL